MDFYVVLGVRRGASDDDIRRAYKRLARQFHPDINPGDHAAAARFRDIAVAYETLADAVRRQRYDQGELTRPIVASAGFTGFDFSPRGDETSSPTLVELFPGVFAPPRDDRPSRGADVHVDVTVSLEEVAAGVHRSVTVQRQATCPQCAGRGIAHAAPAACAACQGAGATQAMRGHMTFAVPCGRCGGTGVRAVAPCQDCNGHGVVGRTDLAVVEVPAGISDGAVLRVEGFGHAGRAGGAPGDVQVRITVAAHPLYRRDGCDIFVEVPVAVHEAALGARIVLPALDGGQLRLRVPPGTQSGHRFRLRDRGLPSGRGDRYGDLVAEVRVMLPAVLDERSKSLLREFGALQRDSVRDARFPSGEGLV